MKTIYQIGNYFRKAAYAATLATILAGTLPDDLYARPSRGGNESGGSSSNSGGSSNGGNSGSAANTARDYLQRKGAVENAINNVAGGIAGGLIAVVEGTTSRVANTDAVVKGKKVFAQHFTEEGRRQLLLEGAKKSLQEEDERLAALAARAREYGLEVNYSGPSKPIHPRVAPKRPSLRRLGRGK